MRFKLEDTDLRTWRGYHNRSCARLPKAGDTLQKLCVRICGFKIPQPLCTSGNLCAARPSIAPIILDALVPGMPFTVPLIAQRTGLEYKQVQNAIARLRHEGYQITTMKKRWFAYCRYIYNPHPTIQKPLL